MTGTRKGGGGGGFNDIRSRAKGFSTNDDSLYKILGVEKDATEDDIRKAYKKMSLKHHPDKNLDDPEATEKFKEVNNANQILSNPNKRKIYDKYGMMGLYIADQIGEENVHAYMLADSTWFKVLVGVCTVLTGCWCCCCCCCCCCNCCCGKFAPKEPEFPEDPNDENAHLYEEDFPAHADPNSPITVEPPGQSQAEGNKL